jgi:phosphoribosylformylglycinamidine (FGAM) synthase-like enzyme
VLNVPIVSGNVSLYNETAGRAIPPTPTVGMVGLLEDVSLAVPSGFAANTSIILLGRPPTELGASEYAGDGTFPRFDLEEERRLGQLLRVLAGQRLLRSAQDVSDGGLAVALAECALVGEIGASLDIDASEVALFSEDQGRAVVSCQPEDVAAVLEQAAAHGVPAAVAGATGGYYLRVGERAGSGDNAGSGDKVGEGLNISLEALRAAWEGAA